MDQKRVLVNQQSDEEMQQHIALPWLAACLSAVSDFTLTSRCHLSTSMH